MNLSPKLKEKDALAAWEEFFTKVDKKLKSLSPGQRNELILELKGHLIESMANCEIESEAGKVYHAIEMLGDIDDFIKPIVTENGDGNILVLPDAKEFTIKSAYSIYWLASRSFYFLLIASGYLIAATIFLVALTKIYYPDKAGLFIKPNGTPIMGFNFENTGFTDPLGYWFIPIGLIIGMLMFWGLWKLVRLALRKR